MCPRCGGRLSPPDLWTSDWSCRLHGAVFPRQPSRSPSAEGLAAVLSDTRVPVWVPWPLPPGWLVTGFAQAGDERSGSRAVAVALSGPGLVSGPADMLLVSEEPGVGLAAHYAGLAGPDPGTGFDAGPPGAKAHVRSGDTRPHPVSLWSVRTASADRAGYVGEAMGSWLWTVLWPADAGVLVLDRLELLDLREPGLDLELPYGAYSRRLDR